MTLDEPTKTFAYLVICRLAAIAIMAVLICVLYAGTSMLLDKEPFERAINSGIYASQIYSFTNLFVSLFLVMGLMVTFSIRPVLGSRPVYFTYLMGGLAAILFVLLMLFAVAAEGLAVLKKDAVTLAVFAFVLALEIAVFRFAYGFLARRPGWKKLYPAEDSTG